MSQTTVEIRDLRLGDIAVPDTFQVASAFSTHIIYKITETEVHCRRAYMTVFDQIYGNSVIPYIGVEDYSWPLTSLVLWTLLYRNRTLHPIEEKINVIQ